MKNNVRRPLPAAFFKPRAYDLDAQRFVGRSLKDKALKITQDASVDDSSTRMSKAQRFDEAVDSVLFLH
jgi:hypothetical protein